MLTTDAGSTYTGTPNGYAVTHHVWCQQRGILCQIVKPERLGTWPKPTFFLARPTADAATQEQPGRRSKLLHAGLGCGVIKVFDVGVSSPAATMLYEHLRRDAINPARSFWTTQTEKPLVPQHVQAEGRDPGRPRDAPGSQEGCYRSSRKA